MKTFSRMHKNNLYNIFILCLLLFLSACDKNKNNPGYVYFPDMMYSRAYETYSENPNFSDDRTMRVPAEGTIPRGYEPFPYEKTEEDRTRAGKELVNPIPYTEENLARGKEVFQNYCMQCHGKLGNGKGFLYTSGRYPFPPATLISGIVTKRPVGELYHTVTLGYGVMGAHGPLLRPEDRWKVVMYVQEDLQKKH